MFEHLIKLSNKNTTSKQNRFFLPIANKIWFTLHNLSVQKNLNNAKLGIIINLKKPDQIIPMPFQLFLYGSNTEKTNSPLANIGTFQVDPSEICWSLSVDIQVGSR